MKAGIIFQTGAIWIGAHYSKHEKRWCICFVPLLTLWIALPGGRGPKSASLITWGDSMPKPTQLPQLPQLANNYPFMNFLRKT